VRAKEFEKSPNKPIVYVDMDGVLADLFNHVGGLHDVEHYTRITKDQWEQFFKNSNAYELFSSLPAFPTANKLLQIVKQYAGGYTILSSPLNFDREGSIKGKRAWLSKHITVPPDNVIFEHQKYKYAVQADGTPNILIDDFRTNITAWRNAGGIGIKYQSDEDSLDVVVQGLKNALTAKEPVAESRSVKDHKDNFVEIFKKFLPLAMHYLKLDSLPKMKFDAHVHDEVQPTFGKYVNQEKTLYVALMNRHPNDILRTVAHELVHYKQDTKHELGPTSGVTGSPEENQAHQLAGIVMRHFNKRYPEYLNSKPITESQKRVMIYSEKTPKLLGLSFAELEILSEYAGADNYSKFDKVLKKNLNLPHWTNTLEIYGVYLRNLSENKLRKVLKEHQSDIEKTLFRELNQRSFESIDSASIGDQVSLLHLTTLNIPGHKILARLNGFLNPKEIVNIKNIGSLQQLEFADGSKYPNTDNGDIFQTIQTWNMTKLFPSYSAASKAYSFYGLIGKRLSRELEFDTNVELDSRVKENFADGKGPGRPGDSQRHGIPKKATMAQLQKAAKAKGRKGQLARWQINMRRGKKK
jgi:hypothetical protein